MFKRVDPKIPNMKTITRHFGSRSGIVSALAELVRSDSSFADISAIVQREFVAAPKISSIVRKTPEGFVYLIKSGDHYKIGQTENIERRFKEIGISLPDKATIIHTIRTDDPPGIEAYWHNRFKEKRANGEWFKLSSTDISAFRKRKFQ